MLFYYKYKSLPGKELPTTAAHMKLHSVKNVRVFQECRYPLHQLKSTTQCAFNPSVKVLYCIPYFTIFFIDHDILINYIKLQSLTSYESCLTVMNT